MPPPRFSDRARFPTFTDLPTHDPDNAGTTSTSISISTTPLSSPYHLLGQVKQNMTITRPTLILTDISGVDFALTWEDDANFDPALYRTGYTVAVPDAVRTTPKQGLDRGKGFVRVPKGTEGGVRVLSGGWDVWGRLEEKTAEEVQDGCDVCGEEGEGAKKCLGCEVVRYCGEDCQRQGWKGGHKKDCKAFKAALEIFG